MRLLPLLMCCLCLQAFAQLQQSRTFPTPPRSIPLQILNCNSGHFYFLRYNKLAHDITIERRRKEDGSIAAFTPLKLDSVNANWFNYESLDFLFFEKAGRIFFVFERVLNSRSTIYLKEIDTMGRTSGFIELASLVAEKNEDRLELRFGLTDDKNLIVARVRFYGMTEYKQVSLIDPLTRKALADVKLPIENFQTGFSRNYAFDQHGNMYYVLLKFTGMPADDQDFSQFLRDRPNVDSMTLVMSDHAGSFRRRKPLPFKGPVRMHSVRCISDTTRLAMHMMYSASDTEGEEHIYFAIWRFDTDLNEVGFRQQRLRDDIAERLTYFDGSEYDSPARKKFDQLRSLTRENERYQQVERRQDTYYKELVIWKSDDSQDRLELQQIIPRKIFFMAGYQYHTIGTVMQSIYRGKLHSFLLEHPGNARVNLSDYRYKDLSRLEVATGGNLAAYTVNGDGTLSKKIVFSGNDYTCIPVPYEGDDERMVFYLVKGDQERFAILPLSQL